MIGAGAGREALDVFGELAVVEGSVIAGVFQAVEFGDATQVECAGEFGVGGGAFAVPEQGPVAQRIQTPLPVPPRGVVFG